MQYHYYQPMWTLVGCGIKTLEDSRRKMADFMPPQADWLQTSVTGFRPDENIVEMGDGSTVKYDYLIVAVGLQIDFGKVKNVCVLDPVDIDDSAPWLKAENLHNVGPLVNHN